MIHLQYLLTGAVVVLASVLALTGLGYGFARLMDRIFREDTRDEITAPSYLGLGLLAALALALATVIPYIIGRAVLS